MTSFVLVSIFSVVCFLLLLRPKLAISSIESVIGELKSCPVQLPSIAELCDALKSCKEWISKHRALAKVFAKQLLYFNYL